MSEEIVQIKRYPNRRFYDLNASKYISQEEIEALVVKGRSVAIRDTQSGKEITRMVLTRILLERQPEKMLLFPTEMLHFILRANEVSAGFLRDYFQHSLTYLEYLSRHGAAAATLAKPMHWVKAWLDSMTLPAAAGGPQVDGRVDIKAEVQEQEDKALRLTRRIEQLEERIRQLEEPNSS